MSRPSSITRPEPLRPDDHILGPDSAPVTVIAYCDFECPFCGRAFVRTKRLRERFAHQLRLVYRHFPLIDRHPFAQHAAEASEAAAEAAGLDLPQFKADLHGRVHASRVLLDVRSGRRSGVTGTPTFFLNDAWLEDDDRLEDMIGRAA